MGISSAAEAELEARIRPEVAVMRARTSYPRRHRPALAALPGGQAKASARPLPPGGSESGRGASAMAGAAEPVTAGARMIRSSASFTAARTVRTATSVASARTVASARSDALARTGRSRTAPGTSPVRLTRRGRLVVGVLAGLAIASAVLLIWLAVTGEAQAASKATAVPAGGHRMIRVVVRPGQTLWNIATTADPSADPRLVIQQIIDDNALSGTTVNAGQVLWVPRS
jgi:LysM domain